MRKLLLFLLILVSLSASSQYQPTSSKTKFVNGIGIGSKDTSQFTAADTIALTIARDSVMYYRYRGFWRPIATGGNLSAYKLISDTLFANGYTTRARLKQGLDSLAATKGTVNSVGLTMPSAFNVANSPITTSGTLAVTAAGNATQYIRGDGALATLPTNGGGGGASVSYYLNGSVNQGTIGGVTYYEMNKTPIIGAGTDFTINANGYVASFLTDANDPALLNIPAGNWNFETYFQASSGGGSPSFYIELYKYDGTTFTLIASNSTSPKLINDGTSIEAYYSDLAVPQTTLTLTDRLAVRIFVTTAGRTITLHTENGHLCQVITTFTTGLTALNGLTEQVQYFATGTSGTDFNIASATATHTFNLPTASATNRGALSSANWTTFNNKIGAGDTAAMLLPYTRVQRFTDSLTNVQSRIQTKLNISDTSAMLSPYARTSNLPSLAPYKLISDTLFVNGYTTRGTTKKVIDSLAAIELNISDTASMLSNYRRTSTKITNSDLVNSTISGVSLGGNLFSHSNGYGISGSAYNGSAAQTWIVDTANISTKANVTALLLGKQNNITLTTTGTSGAATLVGATLNIPNYTPDLSGYVPTSRTITINGTTQDLSSNRTFSVGTVTSVTASSPLASSGGTTPNITIAQASGSQNGFLSSTDWTTFNNKQNALTNPVTGTGTTNYLPKFTGSTTVGNSNLINDASGNLGLGVTPSAWASDWTVLQIGSISSLSQYNSNNSVLLSNNYYNATTSGAAPRYIANGAAGVYQIASNIHYWYNAPSGTANSAMTLTAAMTLDASGRLGIGITSPLTDLQISRAGSSTLRLTNTNNSTNIELGISTALGFVGTRSDNSFAINTNDTERIRVTNTGNLLVGTTTDNGARLQVSGSAYFSQAVNIATGYNLNFNGGTDAFLYADASGGGRINMNGTNQLQLSTGSTARLTINSTGAATFSSTLGINGVADNVKGGQYTATVSDRINFSGVTSVFPTFTRVGNVVVAQGAIQINPTTANTYTEFRINLPSGWGDAGTQPYCGSGTLVDGGSTTTNNDSYRPVSVSIIGNVAYISFYPRTTSTASISFSFQYILP
jgi:hypothetical protein